MWKVIVAGVGAIAVLVAGSVAVIVVVTGEERPRPPTRRDPEGQERRIDGAAPPAARVPAEPGSITYGLPPVEPEQPPPPVARPAPPKDSWEAVPVTARAKSLGRMGGAIVASLNELHDELTACFTAEAQASHAGAAISRVQDAAPMDDSGTIVLMLQLEGDAAGVRIVDAPLEARGGASDELIACAQAKLRGKVLTAPGARPGTKYRLLHPLIP